METNNNVEVVVEESEGGVKAFVKKHRTKIIVGVGAVVSLVVLGLAKSLSKDGESEVVSLPENNEAVDVDYEDCNKVEESVTEE